MGKIVLSALLLMGLAASAHAENTCHGIFPKNSRWVATNAIFQSGISQTTFNDILDKVIKVWGSDVAALGGVLQFNRLWEDGTVNSDTTVQGNLWIINSYGGLARYPGITADAYLTVACHELGHHLGGAPLFSNMGWASVEGEADYFATLKCLKRMFADEDNQKVISGKTIDPFVRSKCETNFPSSSQDQALCIRAGMADLVLGAVAAGLEQVAPPRIETPDTNVVTSTFTDHPHAQCRLDTYFAGTICPAPLNVALDKTDYHIGSCYGTGDGVRPRCWFAP